MGAWLGLVATGPLAQSCSSPANPTATPASGTPVVFLKTPAAGGSPTPTQTPSGQTVSVLHCPPEASNQEIEDQLAQAIGQVLDLDQALKGKRKVYIKPNLGVQELQSHRGRLHAVADPGVLRGVVAVVRRHYSGEIVVGEAPTTTEHSFESVFAAAGHTKALKDLNVRAVDLNQPPYAEFGVPGGGLMFSRYTLSRELADVDFVVSVAKMKSHLCAGVTLSMKNLFGIPPWGVYGCPRRYLHSLIRLPRVLADLGMVFRPDLCIVDGLVGQNGKEWGGPPVDTEVLIAGNNTVATDAVAARYMGADPLADYGQSPYYWDRNPLKLAHEAGLGSARAEDIQVKGDDWSKLPKVKFYVERGPSSQEDNQRKSMATAARAYLAQRDDLLRQHSGKIIAIQSDGKLLYAMAESKALSVGPGLNGDSLWSSAGMGTLIKKVLPADEDPEHMEVYESILAGH